MKLSVSDRILMYGLLPEKGNYKLLKEVVKFREGVLKFNRQESERFDIEQVQTPEGYMQVKFNKEVADSHEIEVKIPILVKAAIVEKLKSMDKSNQLREDLLPLYEKFIV